MGGIAHVSLDIPGYPVISNAMAGRDRMIFDVTPEDRDALERVRLALGARSQADVLRQLIRQADQLAPAHPLAKSPLSSGSLWPPLTIEPAIKGALERLHEAHGQRFVPPTLGQDSGAADSVPVLTRKPFNPQPKKGKK